MVRKEKGRPLVCFIATSLDGFIAGPRGEIDWLFPSGLVQLTYDSDGRK